MFMCMCVYTGASVYINSHVNKKYWTCGVQVQFLTHQHQHLLLAQLRVRNVVCLKPKFLKLWIFFLPIDATAEKPVLGVSVSVKNFTNKLLPVEVT